MSQIESRSTIALLAAHGAAVSRFSSVGAHCSQQAGSAATVGSASPRGQQSEQAATAGAVKDRPSTAARRLERSRVMWVSMPTLAWSFSQRRSPAWVRTERPARRFPPEKATNRKRDRRPAGSSFRRREKGGAARASVNQGAGDRGGRDTAPTNPSRSGSGSGSCQGFNSRLPHDSPGQRLGLGIDGLGGPRRE